MSYRDQRPYPYVGMTSASRTGEDTPPIDIMIVNVTLDILKRPSTWWDTFRHAFHTHLVPLNANREDDLYSLSKFDTVIAIRWSYMRGSKETMVGFSLNVTGKWDHYFPMCISWWLGALWNMGVDPEDDFRPVSRRTVSQSRVTTMHCPQSERTHDAPPSGPTWALPPRVASSSNSHPSNSNTASAAPPALTMFQRDRTRAADPSASASSSRSRAPPSWLMALQRDPVTPLPSTAAYI
ncbi:hypothetical protein NHQ30_009089 [Ciborinia camelliae]|nr:hypothetical protein NHQ30_009089 [Ciborinia camelliae]